MPAFVPDIFSSQASEVEETLKRIQSHKGVVGTIVVNSEGKCVV
jgi:dynein light chain roadblock-type